ncbi:MAG: hypothetical protein GY906_02385, partial [bacterium]|nr:hypothetical protein [bacterium]
MTRAVLAIVLSTVVFADLGHTETPPPTLGREMMPLPAHIEFGESTFPIDVDFSVTIDGAGATERLQRGVQRALRRLSDRAGLFFEPATFLNIRSIQDDATLLVTAQRRGKLALGEDESYRLDISATGIRLDAESDIGALRGLETL